MTPDQTRTLSLLLPNEVPRFELIVPRGDLPEQLRADIQSADAVKLLVAGQRGMGKTTELRRFLYLLDGSEFLPIFIPFGAQQTISGPGLIYAMAQALYAERKAKLDERLFHHVQDWYMEEEVSTIAESGSEGTAGIGGQYILLTGKGQVHRKRGKRIAKTRKPVKDVRELLDRFNNMIDKSRRASKKRIAFVVDDIDKVQDATSIESTFIHASHFLCAINAPCIFTVPITYATSPYLRIAALPYHGIYRVPAVDLLDEKGKPNGEAFEFMRKVFNLRMPYNPLSPDLLDRVLECSGGVLIDAMRMLRSLCKRAILNPQLRIDHDLITEEFQQLVDDYQHVLNTPQLWKRLAILSKAPDKRILLTDDMLPELLYKMIVIEYRHRHAWFDLHPAARELYKQNAQVIDEVVAGQ